MNGAEDFDVGMWMESEDALRLLLKPDLTGPPATSTSRAPRSRSSAGGEKKIVMDSSDDEEDFRFSAKTLLLTYPSCELGAYWLLGNIMDVCEKKEWIITKSIWCDEVHKDGSGHSHIGIEFQSRPNIKDCSVFDCEGYHPNWKPGKGKNAWEGITHYIQKTGRWEGDVVFPKNPKNYIKNKKDWEEWQKDAKAMNQVRAYPLTLIDGTKIMDPKGPKRECIYFIVGESNTGKTKWKNHLRPESFYDVPAEAKYQFEGYAGEPIIVYDDVEPKEFDLVKLTDFTKHKVQVPGESRYVRNYLAINQQRTVIIICNYDKIPKCMTSERIMSRLARVIEWEPPNWDAILKFVNSH